ncbi:unnamed protein product, partial [Anisakis simplex]|uniref:ShTK domain protein n=1 Tax=Anisakis simplex TaxID=6269 RepID=A0A0M3K8B7_ANISI
MQRSRRDSTVNETEFVQPPDFLQPGPVLPGSRGQVASHPYDCMTLTCLCPYFKMSLRREYRMLSETERNRYHAAMTVLKRSGEFDRLCIEHFSVGTGSGAHSGPGFMGWHREFLKRVEIALRLIDPEVSIPYWDNVMDNYLADPRDSILFSPIFEGEADEFGDVVTGPYAYWRTVDGHPAIIRHLGQEGNLWTEGDLQNMMSKTAIEDMLHYTAPLQGCPMPVNLGALEFMHAYVHLWVGGHMRDPPTAANDPIFYPYHAFVDFLWELWRQTHQTAQARETEYAMDIALCEDPQHFSYAPMRPYYNLINLDGLSNMYTDQMYRYARRPGCTETISCDSPYLFCNRRGAIPFCITKIKLYGNCAGFEGMDACFNGVCMNGRCIPGQVPQSFVPETSLSNNQLVRMKKVFGSRQFVPCFNRNPCCELWANDGECKISVGYMKHFCAPACGFCKPAYSTKDDCADRHVACKQWKTEGKCHSESRQFLEENCRESCGFCKKPKFSMCPRRTSVRIDSFFKSRIEFY